MQRRCPLTASRSPIQLQLRRAALLLMVMDVRLMWGKGGTRRLACVARSSCPPRWIRAVVKANAAAGPPFQGLGPPTAKTAALLPWTLSVHSTQGLNIRGAIFRGYWHFCRGQGGPVLFPLAPAPAVRKVQLTRTQPPVAGAGALFAWSYCRAKYVQGYLARSPPPAHLMLTPHCASLPQPHQGPCAHVPRASHWQRAARFVNMAA